MSEKIMMDGEPLEVGDEVFDLFNGFGKVVAINATEEPSIHVKFDRRYVVIRFFSSFKLHANDKCRVLFWQEPAIIPPPKRKKKVKVWDWFVEYKCDWGVRRVCGLSEKDIEPNLPDLRTAQKIDGTEREVEV